MKTKELREMNDDALGRQERELYDQLFKLRFQMATNQSENPGRIRIARKDLARVKTLLRELRGPAVPAKAKAAPGPAAAPGKASAKAAAPKKTGTKVAGSKTKAKE